jgi:hypothetical protein
VVRAASCHHGDEVTTTKTIPLVRILVALLASVVVIALAVEAITRSGGASMPSSGPVLSKGIDVRPGDSTGGRFSAAEAVAQARRFAVIGARPWTYRVR